MSVIGEHVDGQRLLAAQAGQRRMIAVQHDEVRLLSGRQPAHRTSRRPRTAGRRIEIEPIGHLRMAARSKHVALLQREPLPVFEQPQLLADADARMAVRADAPCAALLQIGRGIEHAIAEIGFGGRTDAGHRAAVRQAPTLVPVQMGRVHQAPARVDRRMVQQPVHRPRAAPRQAFVDLALLLGDMDVHRRGRVHRMQPGHRGTQAVGRHRAQRVWRETKPRRSRASRCQPLQQRQHRVGLVQEAALFGQRRLGAEARALVQHRQQRDADARALRGAQQAQRHLGRIGVRRAVGLVMDIVEFADAGIAGAQHLDIELRGDRLQRLGRQPQRKAVHQLAPAPERIVGGRAELGQAGEAALEGVRMQIGHAGQHRPCGARRVGGGRGVGRDGGQLAVGVPAQQHVAGPAIGQQRLGGEQRSIGNWTHLDTPAGPANTRPWRTTAASGLRPNQ